MSDFALVVLMLEEHHPTFVHVVKNNTIICLMNSNINYIDSSACTQTL